MARLARVVVPGLPHHITQRGNRRQQTFRPEDYALYLELMGPWCGEHGVQVGAYMPYEIRYSEEAVQQLTQLRAFEQVAILDQIEQVLGVNPTLDSKARVKRLRRPAPTEYRLRVGEFRVFYDVEGEAVQVVQVLSKEHAIRYLGESS